MNRSLSSKSTKKASPAPAPATANKKKKKKEQSPRNPLRDLNAIRISNNSNNGSEASSSISVEAPRGCLRFFLSHASSSNSKTPIFRPKALPKTPKSAPVIKPSRPSKTKDNRSKFTSLETPEKPMSRNLHKSKNNSSCLNQWHSGNKPSFRNVPKLKTTCSAVNSNGKFLSKLGNRSEVDEGIVNEHKSGGIDGNFTPLSKIGTGLALVSKTVKAEDMQENSDKSNTKTPPIQASVSPEIPCGTSSLVSTNTTLACYAAGHVLSGTTDKRKCRPRGILNVGENDSGFSTGKALCSFEDDDDDVDDNGEVGKGLTGNLDVPLPTEASMHWLLSPCDEKDENHKEHSENSFLENCVGYINLCSPFSASGSHGFSSDVCKNPKMGGNNSSRRRSTSISPSFQELLEPLNDHFPVLSSPHCTPGCEAVSLKDERSHHYDNDNDDESSPFSKASLGSGNVIRTPQSDASIDNHRKDCFDSELSSVAEAIRMASLSPNSHDVLLIEDQMDSSFQFDCLTTTCNSISRFQEVLDDRDSWLSNSTLENMSQSEMRISWREGLMSRMYDMDEYDCCRCLSDKEEDVAGCSNDPLKKVCQNPEINANVGEDENLAYNSRTAEVLGDDIDDEAGGDGGEVEEACPPPSAPPLSSTCVSAESIITDGDGGGLLASGDSDWNLCYKNELFHV